jgi:hypothetical protein
MITFCLWCVSLVLGGWAVGLLVGDVVLGIWLRMARVPARVRRPVWQSDCHSSLSSLAAWGEIHAARPSGINSVLRSGRGPAPAGAPPRPLTP